MTVETRTLEPVSAPTKTVADVLRHAARIIEERGWCQNALDTSDGRVCMVGAMAYAGGWDGFGAQLMPPRSASAEAWDFLYRHMKFLPASFNDAPGRTANEVTAALRAAADQWEAA